MHTASGSSRSTADDSRPTRAATTPNEIDILLELRDADVSAEAGTGAEAP